MSDLMRGAVQGATSVVMLIVSSIMSQTADLPASGLLTGAAGVIGIVAIAQMVRAISRTESQKTQLIEALQKQLAAAYEEIRELHDLIYRLDQHNQDE